MASDADSTSERGAFRQSIVKRSHSIWVAASETQLSIVLSARRRIGGQRIILDLSRK